MYGAARRRTFLLVCLPQMFAQNEKRAIVPSSSTLTEARPYYTGSIQFSNNPITILKFLLRSDMFMAYVEPYKGNRIRRVCSMSYTANVSLLSDPVFIFLNIFIL